ARAPDRSQNAVLITDTALGVLPVGFAALALAPDEAPVAKRDNLGLVGSMCAHLAAYGLPHVFDGDFGVVEAPHAVAAAEAWRDRLASWPRWLLRIGAADLHLPSPDIHYARRYAAAVIADELHLPPVGARIDFAYGGPLGVFEPMPPPRPLFGHGVNRLATLPQLAGLLYGDGEIELRPLTPDDFCEE
ncbi:MAG: hypothetical protein R3F65_23575, partial [bacterium]